MTGHASLGVSAGVLGMPAETPALGWMTVQVSGEMYLPRGDPTHGITMTPAYEHQEGEQDGSTRTPCPSHHQSDE
jgi:hypothetical protein